MPRHRISLLVLGALRAGLRPARPPRGSRKPGAARRFLGSLGAALLAPLAATAGTGLAPPAPGTYYFYGSCASGCTGLATATLVAGADLATSSFSLQASTGTQVLGPLVSLGSSQAILSGPVDMLARDNAGQTFGTAANGSWSFGPNSSLTGTQGSWSTTPVPEPASYATLLVGIAALGVAVMRRRRRTAR